MLFEHHPSDSELKEGKGVERGKVIGGQTLAVKCSSIRQSVKTPGFVRGWRVVVEWVSLFVIKQGPEMHCLTSAIFRLIPLFYIQLNSFIGPLSRVTSHIVFDIMFNGNRACCVVSCWVITVMSICPGQHDGSQRNLPL